MVSWRLTGAKRLGMGPSPVRRLFMKGRRACYHRQVPEKLERKLRAEAERKFPGNKERQDEYVYATMTKLQEEGRIPAWRKIHRAIR
jgi:hypothetical protein